MKELYMHCDSPCWSCPVYGRIRRVRNFNERKLTGAYYCQQCDSYALCKMGIANRRNRFNQLVEICMKCGAPLKKIALSYNKGQYEKPFVETSILVIRKPNGSKFTILRSLKASFFDDLADVLLYILLDIGSGYFDIIDYQPLTQTYKPIFKGFLQQKDIRLKNVPEEKLTPFVITKEFPS